MTDVPRETSDEDWKAARELLRGAQPSGTHWIVVDVEGCARCGGTHYGIAFRPLTNPLVFEDAAQIVLTHWASCPRLLEPILLHTVPEPRPKDTQ